MNTYPRKLPWIERLEENWIAIRNEWRKLPPEAMFTWLQANRKFMTAAMLFFHGETSPFAELCPILMKTVGKVSGLRAVTIQTMQPGCRLTPHHGSTSGVWRVHLGLDVPETCWIKVHGQQTHFKNGKTFCFDDTNTHEAYNGSDRARTNLIVDCWVPISIAGQRVRRVTHRLAHALGVKRSSMAEYHMASMRHALEYKAKHPEAFVASEKELESQNGA